MAIGMELRQLKYFVKTAQTLNFSEAARLLFVTQSTLSQQIRQLEQELGSDLFIRDSHSVQLTESGEQLLPLAQRTLQDAAACQDRIKDLHQILSGSLNIGITYSFAPLLTETVMEFLKIYPGVKLNIFYKLLFKFFKVLFFRLQTARSVRPRFFAYSSTETPPMICSARSSFCLFVSFDAASFSLLSP